MLDEAKSLARMGHRNSKGMSVKRGRVESVSGSTLNVVIDGDTAATPIPAACDAVAGNRVVILCDGTVWAAIATYR